MPDARGVCWWSSSCSPTFPSQRLCHVPFRLRLLLLLLSPFVRSSSIFCDLPFFVRSNKTLNLELHFVVLRNAATPSTRPLTHSSGKPTLSNTLLSQESFLPSEVSILNEPRTTLVFARLSAAQRESWEDQFSITIPASEHIGPSEVLRKLHTHRGTLTWTPLDRPKRH